MSYVVIIRFEGVTEADYWSVNDKLGIKRDGSGPWLPEMPQHNDQNAFFNQGIATQKRSHQGF